MLYILVVTYILGGLTFLPLVALAAIAFAFYTSVPADVKPRKLDLPPDRGEGNNDALRAPPPSLKAWLTVRRTFEASPSSYISIVRTLFDSRATRTRRAEDTYYAVLKGTVLYLYEDEAMSDCAAAIDVHRCDVRIVPDTTLPDGELFAKRNAILLHDKGDIFTLAAGDTKQDLDSVTQKTVDANKPTTDAQAWYIFFRSVHDMEDWYFALLGSPAPFPHDAQRLLIDALDALPDRIPTRWLNALIGRLFLGVKNTRALEEWVIARLMRKLSKVKTPSWLTAVVVRSFDPGDAAPILSKPMLKELTPEGEASVGVDISYIAPQSGGIRITLSATAEISLPATPSLAILGFKKDKSQEAEREHFYKVSLMLAVIVRRIEGNVLVKIKRAPSNRMWYAFTTAPRMDIEVVPIVSDRQIRWGMVLSGIEGKLREIVHESVVLPYMDDIPFFDTTSLHQRGGIFADAFLTQDKSPEEVPELQQPGELTIEPSLVPPGAFVLGSSGSEHTEDINVESRSPMHGAGLRGAESLAPGTGGSLRKRRMWFGGLSGEGEESDIGGEVKTDGIRDNDIHRQRTVQDSSTPSLIVIGNESPAGAPNDITQDQVEAAPSLRKQDSGDTLDSHFASSSPPHRAIGLSTSAPSMLASPSSAPSTPSSPSVSFLATLKSRGAGIAEKQPALKEAMRKWGVGVNWAAGRRKNGDKETMWRSSDNECEKDADADHGDVLNIPWSNASPRGSYADLRRKVEQREQERLRHEGGSTHPIDIPGSRADENAGPLERKSSNTSTLSRRTGSDSSMPSSAVASPQTQFLSPTAPRTTTELHTTPRSSSPILLRSSPSTPLSSPGSTTPFLLKDPQPLPRPAVPIRAQPPKAATMTIPGIHARHRGDLMGFGSGPPDAGPSPGPTTDGQTGRAIQSVYKLLRGGGETESTDGSPMQSPDIGVARPVPPPLPPRSPSTTLAGASSSPQSSMLSEPIVPPFSLASQALKYVAEQDAATRQPSSRRSSLSPTHSPQPSISSDPSFSPTTEIAITPQPLREGEKGWKPPLPPRPRTLKVTESEDVQ